MNELIPPGEFHHFQLVNQFGDVPFSISILVHLNQSSPKTDFDQNILEKGPISSDEVIQLHEELKNFDGDYIRAFSNN